MGTVSDWRGTRDWLIACGKCRWLLYPNGVAPKIDVATVCGLLDIIVSIMLGVTTFALSIMVLALGNIADGTTPRARNIIATDDSARLASNSFVSALIPYYYISKSFNFI